MYKELGGEIITVGSDAHRAEDVGKGVKNCIEIIKEAGFKYIITFNNRTPIFNKIN
jgi:histidinol-phosphatase (PHP family)